MTIRDSLFRKFLFISLFLIFAGCMSKEPIQVQNDYSDGPVRFFSTPSPLLDYAESLRVSDPRTNAVSLLEVGSDALISRIHLIRSAKRNIAIQTFVWADDEAGRLIMYELIQAAKRGVEIRFLNDHLATEQHIEPRSFLAYSHPNMTIKFFNPSSGFFNQPKAKTFFLEKLYSVVFNFKSLNHRMHNKNFIIDELVGITGGRNYQNAYYDLAHGMNYKDRDIMVIGPVVDQMKASFELYWNSEYAKRVDELRDFKRILTSDPPEAFASREDFSINGILEYIDSELQDHGSLKNRFVDSFIPVKEAHFVVDNLQKKDHSLIFFGGNSVTTQHLAKIVSEAHTSIFIQTPYLVLSSPAISLFKKVLKSQPQVDVRISTNSLSSTDSWHVYALSYKQKQKYLQTLKFKIYEFKPLPTDMYRFMPAYETMHLQLETSPSQENPYICLHSKSIVVDDEVSFVGSYNLDPRSQNLNTESGIVIRDKTFAVQLRHLIQNDMAAQNSWVIAKKQRVLGLDHPNALIVKLSDLIPFVDIWPFRYSASFELIEGRHEVDPDDPDFYNNYRDVGSFPYMDNNSFGKEVGARGTKAFFSFVRPLL